MIARKQTLTASIVLASAIPFSLFGLASANATEAGASSGASAQAQASAPTSLNEVTVTAQYRSQTVQDTPLAITALTGQALDDRNITDIAGAGNLAPNVSLTRGAAGFGQMASIFIRGIGQADPHFAVEPGVGMYIDDVYYGVLPGSVFRLLDTDRIEVLRGPQGTLAGKNSIGGSIKLFSRQPGPDPDAYAELSYGSLNLVSGRAASNFTLVEDQLYARISFAGERRDGYLDRLDYGCVTGNFSNGTQQHDTSCKLGTQGGEELWTARASLKWTPSNRITNTLIFDIDEDNSENPAAKTIIQSPLWAGTNNYITCAKCYTNYETYIGYPMAPNPASTGSVVLPSKTPLSAMGVTNKFQYDFTDMLRVESITAYRTSDVKFVNPMDATPASINDQLWRLHHKQFTQELRLSGEFSDFAEWTVGGFYYDAKGTSGGRIIIDYGLAPGGGLPPGLPITPLDIFFRDPVKTRSKSVFAHAALHPTDRLTVTLGIRYTDDLKRFTFVRYHADGTPDPSLLYNVNVAYKGSHTDYRANLSYEWSDSLMTYAQISTGYRGGGVNPRPFFISQALPYNPETLTAYEVGLKSELFDRRATFNLSAFYNQFKNLQGVLNQCDAFSPFPGAPCAMNTNIGNAHIKGLELEAQVTPVDGLRFDGSIGLLDFQYKNVAAGSGITLDMKPAYAPSTQGQVGVQYEFSLGGAGTLTPRFDLTYRSKLQTLNVNSADSQIASLTLLNARIAWRNPDNNWELAFAVSNLTDKFYYESLQVTDNPVFPVGTGRPGLPRQWKFTVRRNF